MSLTSGTLLGPYEILAPIGAGGMGEVYRARDTRLDRTVAVKVLPGHLTHDPHLRERFDREARAVSSLNHPNICVLYDIGEEAIGEEGGIGFLVMEYLEGESLAVRLQRGPLPVADALRYGIEIAGALDAAHRRGVIHRDLKPGNIVLTKTGAKLLDFGLAKVRGPAAAAAEHTVTMAITTEGSIVGTFQYMSPEQLEGREADARSDIFAFGATLYEMLTGRRAFQGASHASLITAIMSADPAPISSIQPGPQGAPLSALDRVVRRCLAKDPDNRWQTACDLKQELIWIQEGGSQAAPVVEPGKRSTSRIAWAAAGVFALAAIVLAVPLFHQEKPVPLPLRFTIDTPQGTVLTAFTRPAISPDGASIVFAAGSGGQSQLYLHSLTAGSTRPLPGTDEAFAAYWSSDSHAFLLNRAGTLSRMDLSGGPPQALTLPFQAGSSSWGPEGVVSTGSGVLQWFQPDGSAIRQLRAPGPGEAGGFLNPSLIPGSRWLMYNARASVGTVALPTAVHLLTTDGTTAKALFTADSPALYGAPGYALYVRGGALMARPFDPQTGELRGEAASLVEGVAITAASGVGAFSSSGNGILVYQPGGAAADSQLTWFDRTGKNLGTVGSAAEYTNPALSPDGSRLAVGIRDPGGQGRDIWVFDLARSTAAKLTFDPKDDLDPVWSPDGSRIAFTSDRRGVRNIYVKSAFGTGAEELLAESKTEQNAEDWSRDGRSIVYNALVAGNGRDIWTLSPDTRKSQPFLATKFSEDQAQFSPDGKWIAYRSNESGRNEVYVQPFTASEPGSRGKWLLSNAGGSEPHWRADGLELFYASLSIPPKIMAVDIAEKNGAIMPGIPHALFEVRLSTSGRNRWVVSADGKKFVAIVPVEQKPANTLNVIVNWPSLLRK